MESSLVAQPLSPSYRHTIKACSSRRHHLPQERSLLRQDEFVLLGEGEVRRSLCVGAQGGAIALVSRETVERNQSEGDVVGAFMGHEIACQSAATARNDAEPPPGVALELLALMRIDLIANENSDGHDDL